MSDLFQSVPFAVVLLIIGFVFLVKGADAFVEGCSSIARRYHVPSLIIGMTIVAMGTSLPETAVSVTAAVTGNNALAVSNAVGSNIFNLMVVVGACTLFTSVAVQINTLKIDFPISILCAVLLLILGAAVWSLIWDFIIWQIIIQKKKHWIRHWKWQRRFRNALIHGMIL